MPYDTIVYAKKGKIAHIILNRPQILNAYNDTMGDELLQAHREFDQDDDLHVLILSACPNSLSSFNSSCAGPALPREGTSTRTY